MQRRDLFRLLAGLPLLAAVPFKPLAPSHAVKSRLVPSNTVITLDLKRSAFTAADIEQLVAAINEASAANPTVVTTYSRINLRAAYDALYGDA